MNVMIPYKRDFLTLNKSVINYQPGVHITYFIRSQGDKIISIQFKLELLHFRPKMLRTYLLVHGYVYVLLCVCLGVVLYLWLAFKLIMDHRKNVSTFKSNRERVKFEEACQTTLSTVPYFFSLLLTGENHTEKKDFN